MYGCHRRHCKGSRMNSENITLFKDCPCTRILFQITFKRNCQYQKIWTVCYWRRENPLFQGYNSPKCWRKSRGKWGVGHKSLSDILGPFTPAPLRGLAKSLAQTEMAFFYYPLFLINGGDPCFPWGSQIAPDCWLVSRPPEDTFSWFLDS